MSVLQTSEIILNNCYFPKDSTIGSGFVKGNPIKDSKTLRMFLNQCKLPIVCTYNRIKIRKICFKLFFFVFLMS